MIDQPLAEQFTPAGEGIGVRQRPLHQGDAADAVGDAREVQHFEDVIDAVAEVTEQVGFALAQFDFARRHRAGSDLVLEPSDGVVE